MSVIFMTRNLIIIIKVSGEVYLLQHYVIKFVRSVVFSGFIHQYNWQPRYTLNIVESGVKHKHYNSNPIVKRIVSFLWNKLCVLIFHVCALCALRYQFLWIVHFWLPLRCSLTLIRWYTNNHYYAFCKFLL